MKCFLDHLINYLSTDFAFALASCHMDMDTSLAVDNKD